MVKVPVDRVSDAFKAGAQTKRESDAPVRVVVYVDSTATPFLVDVIRRALVPQSVNGIVRVCPLCDAAATGSEPRDLSLVITGGSPGLESAVHTVVISGAPTCIVAESSVEAPFVTGDAPLLGLVCATDEAHLLDSLATWILSHVQKRLAFAANFEFVRGREADYIVSEAAAANLVTGALAFVPGSDFPVMTLAQLGMMLKLAAAYGKPLKAERAYEGAGVIALALALRAVSRHAAPHAGRLAFAVKALIGCGGTLVMGRALEELYTRDIDYSPINEALLGAVDAVRSATHPFFDNVTEHV